MGGGIFSPHRRKYVGDLSTETGGTVFSDRGWDGGGEVGGTNKRGATSRPKVRTSPFSVVRKSL